jgi:hypothetical protein
MPKGTHIVEVESWRVGKEPVSKGKVSIYAFPGGYVDAATVTLAEVGKEEQQKFKVQIQSLTGRIKVESVTQKR